MDLSIWLEVIKLPATADRNEYGLKLHWRNPPETPFSIYANKAWKGYSARPPKEDLVRLATEALKDLFANQYGMEREWPMEVQTWWCIYRAHRRYIERTIVDSVNNAVYTSF